MLFPLLAPESTVAVVDRTETRARIVDGAPAADVETNPSLTYRLRARRGRLGATVAYAPRLVLTWPGDGTTRFEHVQGARVGFENRGERVRYGLLALGSYGDASAATLFVQPAWTGEGALEAPAPLPLDARVSLRFVSLQGAVSTGHTFDRRTDLLLTASYFVYGGPEPEAQVLLPFQTGPGIDAVVRRAISRTEDVFVGVNARQRDVTLAAGDGAGGVTTAGGPWTAVGGGELRYRMRVGRRSSWGIMGGVSAAAEEELPARSVRVRALPSGEVDVRVGFDSRFAQTEWAASVRVGPWVNLFTGELATRFEGLTAFRARWGRTALGLEGAALFAPSGLSARGTDYRLFYGQLVGRHAVSRTWTVDGGVRLGVQRVNDPFITSDILQPYGFLGVTYSPWPLRL